MIFFLDANVIIDLIAARPPFAKDVITIMERVGNNEIKAFLPVHMINDIYYVLTKHNKDKKEIVRKQLVELYTFVPSVSLDSEMIQQAECLNFTDFEDSLIASCALRVKANYIITSNIKDFITSPIKAISPTELFCVTDNSNYAKIFCCFRRNTTHRQVNRTRKNHSRNCDCNK